MARRDVLKHEEEYAIHRDWFEVQRFAVESECHIAACDPGPGAPTGIGNPEFLRFGIGRERAGHAIAGVHPVELFDIGTLLVSNRQLILAPRLGDGDFEIAERKLVAGLRCHAGLHHQWPAHGFTVEGHGNSGGWNELDLAALPLDSTYKLRQAVRQRDAVRGVAADPGFTFRHIVSPDQPQRAFLRPKIAIVILPPLRNLGVVIRAGSRESTPDRHQRRYAQQNISTKHE